MLSACTTGLEWERFGLSWDSCHTEESLLQDTHCSEPSLQLVSRGKLSSFEVSFQTGNIIFPLTWCLSEHILHHHPSCKPKAQFCFILQVRHWTPPLSVFLCFQHPTVPHWDMECEVTDRMVMQNGLTVLSYLSCEPRLTHQWQGNTALLPTSTSL